MNPDLDRQPARNPWPYAGDTALQRARRLAIAYRQHLNTTNPTLCAALDDAARSYGETWICDHLITVPDDHMLTTSEAAEYAGVDVETIRQWRKRGYIGRGGERQHLQVRGLTEQGWPMFRADEIQEIAETTRRNRLTRGRA